MVPGHAPPQPPNPAGQAVSPRPLVRRTPNGTRYIAPNDLPKRPRYSAAITPTQPARRAETAPERTPEATPTAEASGRGSRGKKLTDDEVREILGHHSAGTWTQADLAYIYEVSQTAIHSIVHGKTYLHVKPAASEEN